MLTLAFIPGAFHGSWCFDRVTPILKAAGFRIITFDLPGTGVGGSPSTPPDQAAWTDHVADALRQLEEPVILIGHSRGGIVSSLVAEACPDRVALNIYLAAALLPNGTVPIVGMLHASGSAVPDDLSTLPAELPVPAYEATRQSIYNLCTQEDARAAYSKLRPEPVAPMCEAMILSDGNFGRVPRAYIECLRDNAVPIEIQRAMQHGLPCGIVDAIDTDHSPFLSAPEKLADALTRVVSRHFERG